MRTRSQIRNAKTRATAHVPSIKRKRSHSQPEKAKRHKTKVQEVIARSDRDIEGSEFSQSVRKSVVVRMARRIVKSLFHPSDPVKVKDCYIPIQSLRKANITPSEFRECWKAYKDTHPTDEQLESLFKIGCWHQTQQTKGNIVNADMIATRAKFVQELVARCRAADRPPFIPADRPAVIPADRPRVSRFRKPYRGVNVDVKMKRRTVQSLCHPSDTDKLKNRRKSCHIPERSFSIAKTTPSEFRECWKVYMDKRPTDEQLDSLFKIGRWHQPQQFKGNKIGDDLIEDRAKFVQEVVTRSRTAKRPPVNRVEKSCTPKVQIKMPRRIVRSLCGQSNSDKVKTRKKTCFIPERCFVIAKIKTSEFRECWKAYKDTHPTDEQLESLFKIGCWHQPQNRGRGDAAKLQARTNFVQEVVARGRAAARSPIIHTKMNSHGVKVAVKMPSRIAQSLCDPSCSDKVKKKQKSCNIPVRSFATAKTTPSEFLKCWKAYMDIRPTDEQLESLFKIGCWHRPLQTEGNKIDAEMMQARAKFVEEVVARGRTAERPSIMHAVEQSPLIHPENVSLTMRLQILQSLCDPSDPDKARAKFLQEVVACGRAAERRPLYGNGVEIVVRMPLRIVRSLCHPSDSDNVKDRKKTCYIPDRCFAKAKIDPSEFYECWEAYMDTNPTHDQLESLFKIGCWHQPRHTKLHRSCPDAIRARVKFVQEVIARGRAVERPVVISQVNDSE